MPLQEKDPTEMSPARQPEGYSTVEQRAKMKHIVALVLFALVSNLYAADYVANCTTSPCEAWPYGTVAKGTKLETPTAQSATGRVKWCGLPGTGAPDKRFARCVAATVPDPAPTPVPPTPTPTPPGAQTPESILSSKHVSVAVVDPTTNTAGFYAITGARVRFMSPNGSGTACSIAAPCNPRQIFVDSKPGDLNVFRAGEYREIYGGNWGQGNFAFGAAQTGISIVGMPSEVAKVIAPRNDETNFTLANGDSLDCPTSVADDPAGKCNQPNAAHDVTIAGLHLVAGSQAVDGGGYWERQESGARNTRVVGNYITALYTNNTWTGVVTMQGDDCKILYNHFDKFGTSPPIKNNHAVYVQTGPDRCEIAYNRFTDLRLGHVIQFHNDGTKRRVDGANVHHNVLRGTNAQDMRGINFGDVAALSGGKVENNILENLGQDFSAFVVYCGDIEFRGNQLRNIAGGSSGKVWTGTAGSPCSPVPRIRASGNVFTGGTGQNWAGNIVKENGQQ